jgi:hypothetical protein
MLIVMGVIILALMMAVPAIRALTGTKSTQAAQNVVSAYLASARADAVGIQDIEGILFYLDPGTGRVTLVEVAQAAFQTTDINGVVYLDLEGAVHGGKSRDPLVLPAGIQLMTFKDTVLHGVTAWNDPFPNARYLGFNYFVPSNPTSLNATLGGVILFDGNGRLWSGRYGFRFVASNTNGTPSGNLSPLGALVFGNVNPSPLANWPATATQTQGIVSQTAFALFDRETFLNQRDSSGNPFLDVNDSTSSMIPGDTNPAQTGQDSWLDINTTPILVNRYNGTLIRAE